MDLNEIFDLADKLEKFGPYPFLIWVIVKQQKTWTQITNHMTHRLQRIEAVVNALAEQVRCLRR